MAVGKYYSQTKALSQLKKRERPSVDLLDQDAQHFVSECVFWDCFVFVHYLLCLRGTRVAPSNYQSISKGIHALSVVIEEL